MPHILLDNNYTPRYYLHISSILGITLPIHAYYARDTIYHHLLLLNTIFSIYFHAGKKELCCSKILRICDRIMAHISFGVFIIRESQRSNIIILFPTIIAGIIWIVKQQMHHYKLASNQMQHDLHLIMHLILILSGHMFIYTHKIII